MPLQSLNQGSIQRQGPCVFSPDQVVCAILGQQSVVLNGFGGDIDPELSMYIPNVLMSGLQDLNEQEKIISADAKKRMVRLQVLAGAVITLAVALGVIVGSIFGKLGTPGGDKSKQSVRWQTVAVRQAGVELLVGQEHIVIAVGGILPSGEVLQSVDVPRQVFSTPNQVVNVKKQGFLQ